KSAGTKLRLNRGSTVYLVQLQKNHDSFRSCGSSSPQWTRAGVARLTHDHDGHGFAEAIIYDYGTSVFLSRLIEPVWFQALGPVMGLDWPVETRLRPLTEL